MRVSYKLFMDQEEDIEQPRSEREWDEKELRGRDTIFSAPHCAPGPDWSREKIRLLWEIRRNETTSYDPTGTREGALSLLATVAEAWPTPVSPLSP